MSETTTLQAARAVTLEVGETIGEQCYPITHIGPIDDGIFRGEYTDETGATRIRFFTVDEYIMVNR